ncbi:MAG TPA: hypothetical protein VNK67_05280 [Burkholderiales bacterium]|nr:hypothetical protein [Burkholderiales bacterium]
MFSIATGGAAVEKAALGPEGIRAGLAPGSAYLGTSASPPR